MAAEASFGRAAGDSDAVVDRWIAYWLSRPCRTSYETSIAALRDTNAADELLVALLRTAAFACVERTVVVHRTNDELYVEPHRRLDHLFERCVDPRKAITVLPVVVVSDEITHAVVLLIDVARREVEFFNPWGFHGSYRAVEEAFAALLRDRLPDFRFVSQQEHCPVGPQWISRDAACITWSLLYAFLRAADPSADRLYIIRRLSTDATPDGLRALVHAFACWAHDHAEAAAVAAATDRLGAELDERMQALQPDVDRLEDRFAMLDRRLWPLAADRASSLFRQMAAAEAEARDLARGGDRGRAAALYRAALDRVPRLAKALHAARNAPVRRLPRRT
ncbi:Hypothetical protein UVM_LOCUS219 [uncultured virus]|nr:Hypothetical protein UVM_LOCUS219 [uncultured virus]